MDEDVRGRVIRHTKSEPIEFPGGDTESIVAIAQHFERHIGRARNVLHEIVSHYVHIDVHIIEPTSERPYYTLFTSGMSDRPMHTSDDSLPAYAELFIKLPASWDIGAIGDGDVPDSVFWPIGTLKSVARLPHEYKTWIGPLHTIPNGDPPQPLASNTQLCCAMTVFPWLESESFSTIAMPDGREVSVYGLVALLKDEVDYKLKRGGEALMDRYLRAGFSDVLDVSRRSCVKRRLFGR